MSQSGTTEGTADLSKSIVAPLPLPYTIGVPSLPVPDAIVVPPPQPDAIAAPPPLPDIIVVPPLLSDAVVVSPPVPDTTVVSSILPTIISPCWTATSWTTLAVQVAKRLWSTAWQTGPLEINGQTVEMDDGKSGYVGSRVDLRCRFINSSPPVKISQVTWQKLVNGTKQNVAIANPSLGVSVAPPYRDRVTFKNAAVRRRSPSLEDTTITFTTLRLSDEATYICEYTTFPAGNRENTVNLSVYVRPTTQMSLSTPTLVARSSNLKTPVATCTSANGKPPGTIRWETRVAGEVTTREYKNSYGTFTVQSDYILVPTKERHKESLTCVTTYNKEVYTDSATLDIQYEPDVSVDGFDGNWYVNRENVQLSCQADANPDVSLYQWRL
ncbi:nectin 1a-like [Pholidichthys leucotaenia]